MTYRLLATLFSAAIAVGCGASHTGDGCRAGEVECCGICIDEGSVCECRPIDRDAGPDASVDVDATPLGCVSNAECGPSAYCAIPACGDLGPGICEPRPEACLDIYDPVCGCDGQTYGNSCQAAGAGVNVDRAGPCEEPPLACGTRGGVQCEAGEFCYRDRDPHCGANDLGGTCIVPPTACDGEFAPVCGCDGVTYGNECEAQASSASVRFDGPCEAPGTCAAQDVAIVDPSCDLQTIYWNGTQCVDASGCCEGTDCGNGYDSLAECRRARRSCDRYCGGWLGATCLEDEFCDFAEPGCDWADASGVCRSRPEGCFEPGGIPVCGCDGQSYDSECSAHFAGTDAAGEGPCAVPG